MQKKTVLSLGMGRGMTARADMGLPRARLYSPSHAETQGRRDAEGGDMNDVNAVTGMIVDSAYRIHSTLGPGLMEHVYETIRSRDLGRRGVSVERQRTISFDFEGLWFEDACRVDLIVERCVAVEIKSVATFLPRHGQQLLTYLRLLDYRVGLLLNFGAPLMKDGIKRIANRV
jgi:iron complex transport system substrate-binding protein